MKTVVCLFLFLMVTVSKAQDVPEREPESPRHYLTPEKMAELQTKQMTLALNLDEKQQRELLKMNTEFAQKRKQYMENRTEKRKKGEKPSPEERYRQLNGLLDQQIERQRRMKALLNDNQFEQWKSRQDQKQEKRRMQPKERHRAMRSGRLE